MHVDGPIERKASWQYLAYSVENRHLACGPKNLRVFGKYGGMQLFHTRRPKGLDDRKPPTQEVACASDPRRRRAERPHREKRLKPASTHGGGASDGRRGLSQRRAYRLIGSWMQQM